MFKIRECVPDWTQREFPEERVRHRCLTCGSPIMEFEKFCNIRCEEIFIEESVGELPEDI